MNYYRIYPDCETANRSGAFNMFQIIALEDFEERDVTSLIDQGVFHHDVETVRAEIAKSTGIAISQIDVELDA